MGTEVLRPQDWLVDGLGVRPASFQRRRNISGHGNLKNLGTHQKQNNNNKENRKTSSKEDQKKRSNPKGKNSKKSRDGGVSVSNSNSRQRNEIDLVMGQITLLRRGESLDSCAARIKRGNQQNQKSESQIPAVDVNSVHAGDVIVPESPPDMFPKKIRVEAIDTYAGSGFFLSPSPRALPIPSFFNINKMPKSNGGIVPHGTAASDLLRRLRL